MKSTLRDNVRCPIHKDQRLECVSEQVNGIVILYPFPCPECDKYKCEKE